MLFKKFWIRLLLIFLLLDAGFSFYQHYNNPLEGDMSGIVYPSKAYQKVLDNPFGFNVIKNGDNYPATNRFFAHKIMSVYFKTVPIWLQKVVDPINSIYLATAIIKTFIQLLLIYLLAVFITGYSNLKHQKVIVAMVLVTPLFQANGYHEYFGIIDRSITYTMFYALGNAFVLLFFLPFALKYIHHKNVKFNLWISIALVILAIVIAFHSPTNSGVILVLCPLAILLLFFTNYKDSKFSNLVFKIFESIKRIPKPILFLFAFISIVSLYSFYLGTFNSENNWYPMSLQERYIRLLQGIGEIVSFKLGQFLFFTIVFLNILLVYKQKKSEERDKVILVFWIVFAFSIIYMFLLPLGGFRIYRPLIIRRDTIMPVLLGFMIIYGMSSVYLFQAFRPVYKKIYLVIIITFLIILTNADKSNTGRNYCERDALGKIASSKENLVILDNDCSVMAWRKISKFEQSENAANMLHYWRVTDEVKLYKNKE